MYEKLIKNAAQELQPLLDQKAPFAEMASVWANQPAVYQTFIDKRKNPGRINRENSYIILSWEAWEEAGLSLKERVAKMHADGFGDLTPTNLQKRAERLELSPKIDDKPKNSSSGTFWHRKKYA